MSTTDATGESGGDFTLLFEVEARLQETWRRLRQLATLLAARIGVAPLIAVATTDYRYYCLRRVVADAAVNRVEAAIAGMAETSGVASQKERCSFLDDNELEYFDDDGVFF